MALKPENVTQWVTAVTGGVAAVAAAVVGTYVTLQSAGLIGGKLEAVNGYLNAQHIAEEYVKNVLSEDPSDQRAEFVFDNGDTLYFRQWVNADGTKQKLKRWTSKTPIDTLYERSTARRAPVGAEEATVVARMIPVFDEEVYVGETEDGYYVYYIPEEDVCEVQDSTGEIQYVVDPPCEQYVEGSEG